MDMAAPSSTAGESALWDNRQKPYRDQTGNKTINQFHKYRLPFDLNAQPYCPRKLIVLFYFLSRKLMGTWLNCFNTSGVRYPSFTYNHVDIFVYDDFLLKNERSLAQEQ